MRSFSSIVSAFHAKSYPVIRCTVVILLAVLSGATLAIGQMTATTDTTLPAADQRVVLTVVGRGVQIYACQSSVTQATSRGTSAKQYQWAFVAPVARLFRSVSDGTEEEIGSHGDGPVWNSYDGSSIHGQVVIKQAAPDAGSIPWLLLKGVAPAGHGVFTSVDFIRRSDTRGGIAPTDGCNPAHIGDLSRAPYSATYTFYAAP